MDLPLGWLCKPHFANLQDCAQASRAGTDPLIGEDGDPANGGKA